MELPKKVYIHKSQFWGLMTNECNTTKEDVEYIRKDAFIEKACEKLKKCMYDNLMFQGRLHRKEVIDNFVEDFQNYIKGE